MSTMLAQHAPVGQSRFMGIRRVRVYDLVHGEVDPGDATVALVDRMWPRGVSKKQVEHDEWDKDVAPSTDLRKEFHSGDIDFDEFAQRYRAELAEDPRAETVRRLAEIASSGDLILAYAAKDVDHNNAEVLEEVIRERM